MEIDADKLKFKLVKKYHIYRQDNLSGVEEYIGVFDSIEDIENRTRGLIKTYYNDTSKLYDKWSEDSKMKCAVSFYMERPFIIVEKQVIVPEIEVK